MIYKAAAAAVVRCVYVMLNAHSLCQSQVLETLENVQVLFCVCIVYCVTEDNTCLRQLTVY